MPLWNDKKLAFIHAAGSPDPSRSHFDAQLYIENGTPGHADHPGWLDEPAARGAARAAQPDRRALGRPDPALYSQGAGGGRQSAAWTQGGGSRWRSTGRKSPAPSTSSTTATTSRARPIARAAPRARSWSPTWEATSRRWPITARRRPTAFRRSPARLAQLVTQDKHIRLAFASLGGWDTHARQGNDKGQLAGNLKPLGDGLAALAQGLGQDWNDTVARGDLGVRPHRPRERQWRHRSRPRQRHLGDGRAGQGRQGLWPMAGPRDGAALSGARPGGDDRLPPPAGDDRSRSTCGSTTRRWPKSFPACPRRAAISLISLRRERDRNPFFEDLGDAVRAAALRPHPA